MFYVIGPIEDSLKELFIQDKEEHLMTDQEKANREILLKDAESTGFGFVSVDPLVLSALYQEVRDLIDKMKSSEKLSPA